MCQQAITPTPGIYPPARALAAAYTAHLRSVHPDYVLWQKSQLKYGIMIGIALAILASVPVFYLGIYVFHLSSSFGRGFAIVPIIAFTVPVVLINRRGARGFAEQWRNLHGSMPVQPVVQEQQVIHQQSSYSPSDDGTILQIAGQLTTQLGISNYTPTFVIWQNMYPIGNSYGNVPSDQCVIRGQALYFAENMKGKLEAEDWKPIIASALVYNHKIHDRMLIDFFLRLTPILALYILGWFLIPPIFPTVYYYNPNGSIASYNNVGWEILIFGGIALAIALIPISMRWLNGLKLKADREAAKTVGMVQFVESLKKIGQASPSDVDRVNRRINNLQPAI